MPYLYVIAGCNGAGKTTTSFTVLPEMLNCKEFVNAYEIARGLSPFQPETVSFQAGRIMLNRIHDLIHSNSDFGFETTLSTKSYFIGLLLAWIGRVGKKQSYRRVKKGGHTILPSTIERRYFRGIKNFFQLYQDVVDSWVVYDNSKASPEIIAKGVKKATKVYIYDIWKTIQSQIWISQS